MNIGLMLGKYVPMHQGHKYAILQASTLCSKLIVLLCIDHLHDPKYPSPTQREQILREELHGLTNVEVRVVDCTAFPYAKDDDEEVSKYWSTYLYKTYPEVTSLFGSEDYIRMMADHWPACNGIDFTVIDINRDAFPISATEIRQRPYSKFNYLVESAKPLFTKHVLVIGSESCGKSTLVKNLGDILQAPTIPEMYRSMFPRRGMDFLAEDLVSVAATQNAAVKCQIRSPLNRGLILHDTCNDVTLQYLREYYPNSIFEERITAERDMNECRFDLILFCDIDVPWGQDGTRTLGGDSDRQATRDRFYSLAVEKSNRHDCPLVLVGANHNRIPAALEAIKEMLK